MTSTPITTPNNEEEEKKKEDLFGQLPALLRDENVIKEAPWYQKLAYSVFMGDFHPDQLSSLKGATTREEARKNFAEQFTNFDYTKAATDELARWDSPTEALARSTYLATRAILPKDIANTAYLGTSDAVIGAVQNIFDLGEGDYIDKGLGWTDDLRETVYETQGFKPPSEWTEREEGGADARQALMLNLWLALGTWGAGNLAYGSTKLPWLANAVSKIDPLKAKTLWGGLGKLTALNVLDEIPSTFLDSTHGRGSAASLLSFLGVEDPATEPGLTRFEQNQKAFLPNLTAAISLMSLFNAGTIKKGIGDLNVEQTISKLKENVEALVSSERFRALRSNNYFNRRKAVRDNQVDKGLIKEEPTGEYVAGEKVSVEEAEQQLKNKYINEPDSTYESDALEEAIKGNASDDQLLEIRTRQEAGENVVEATNEVLMTPSGDVVDPLVREEFVFAPAKSIADSNLSDQLGSSSTETLKGLVANSPRIAKRIKLLTGKNIDQADRIDIVAAIKDIEAKDGVTVLPNRLTGQSMLPVNDIAIDPARFQFKQNVDKSGTQVGGSLTGVEKWNPSAEGVIQVFEDPLDGKTYVVNGHNRLKKAKELGINSIRVEYLTGKTAADARFQGAVSNIGQGTGTGVDAAKFFRGVGANANTNWESLGLPMKSGLAAEGLSLSRLPHNIFQDLIDGKFSRVKAMALGDSGLDKLGMQKAYKTLIKKDMSDATFNEVIQQAKSSPTIEGKQIDLFGNKESLNLMVEKGRLAAAIRSDLLKDKNLFTRVGQNAEQLKKGGNVIDTAGSGQVASEAQTALARFDAEKYTESDLSELLNEGAIEISNGAKISVVKNRIRRQYLEALKGSETIVPPQVAKQEPLPPSSEQLLTDVIADGLKKGELRPPSTALPTTPKANDLDLDKAIDDLTAGKMTKDSTQLLDDELRLMEQHGKIDDAMKADKLKAERDASGYNDLTYEEKKKLPNGPLEGLSKPELLREVRRAAQKIEPDVLKEKFPDVDFSGIFRLPNDLKRLKPRYGGAVPEFESEIDAVAYSIRSNKTKSKREDDYVAVIESFGLSKNQVKAHGVKVHQAVKDEVKRLTGSAKASFDNTSGLDVKIPDQGFNEKNIQMSNIGPDMDFSAGEYDERLTRSYLQWVSDSEPKRQGNILAEYGRHISQDVMGRIAQSKELGREMAVAIRDAAIISGVPVERIKYLDQINAIDMFGLDKTIGSTAEWRPKDATFMARNPNDPLTAVAAGQLEGVRVPRGMDSPYADSIFLALHPAINRRYGGALQLVPPGGRLFGHTAAHEAFHAVQQLLDDMHSTKLLDALYSEESLKEMRSIISKGYGNVQKDMSPSEIQAEAFAVWHTNRKIKLRSGLIKGAFERMKIFLSSIRRKMNKILNSDPTYVDVFELAASGAVARKAMIKGLIPEQLDGLIPRINASTHALVPELTTRAFNYLEAKKVAYDDMLYGTNSKFNMEGCI